MTSSETPLTQAHVAAAVEGARKVERGCTLMHISRLCEGLNRAGDFGGVARLKALAHSIAHAEHLRFETESREEVYPDHSAPGESQFAIGAASEREAVTNWLAGFSKTLEERGDTEAAQTVAVVLDCITLLDHQFREPAEAWGVGFRDRNKIDA